MKKLLLLFLIPLLMCTREAEEVEQKIIEEMALPTTNLSVSQVSATLGSPLSNDVGTLCTHSNINKWSKWKPVRFNKVTGLTLTDLRSVDFGLSHPTGNTNYQNIIGVKWGYNRPRGGVFNEPYRIGDFRGYDHNANPIIAIPDKIEFNRSTTPNYLYQIAINRGGESSSQIGIDDFANELGSYYFGLVIVKGGYSYMVTSPNTLSDSGDVISLDATKPPFNTDGSGTVYNILSSRAVTDVNLIQNVSPAPFFKSVPIADDMDDMIPLTITSGTGTIFVITRIRDTATGLYYPIDDYISRPGISLPTSGGLFFQVEITNNSGSSIFLQKSLFSMGANPTFWGSNTNYFECEMYQGSTPIDSLNVAAQTTQTIRLGVSNLLNRNGLVIQQPNPGLDIESIVRIRYNSVVVENLSLLFKST